MIPTTDTNADSFMRRILSDLADPVPRLVFADWLEETSTPSNVAWANFIRAQAELATLEECSRAEGLRHFCQQMGLRTRALLKLPVESFLRDPLSLLQLLPASNLHVQLTGLAVPREVVELVPESVAREDLALPIAFVGPALLFAAAVPEDVSERLQFILNRPVIVVRADEEQVRAAVQHHYGNLTLESVSAILVFPDGDRVFDYTKAGLAGEGELPVNRLVYLLLAEAVRSDTVTGLVLRPVTDSVEVWHEHGPDRSAREPLPKRLASPVTARLRALAALTALPPDGGTETGEILHNFDGRWFRLPLQVAPGEYGPVTRVQILPPLPPTAVNPAA